MSQYSFDWEPLYNVSCVVQDGQYCDDISLPLQYLVTICESQAHYVDHLGMYLNFKCHKILGADRVHFSVPQYVLLTCINNIAFPIQSFWSKT